MYLPDVLSLAMPSLKQNRLFCGSVAIPRIVHAISGARINFHVSYTEVDS